MPRAASDAFMAAIGAPGVSIGLLVELQFESAPTSYSPAATLRYWTGLGPLDWNGAIWTGSGSLLHIPQVEDAAAVQAIGVAIQMSGLDPTILDSVLNANEHGLPATVYLAAFDDTGAVIDAPVIFRGFVDACVVATDADKSVITIHCESRLIEMNTPVDRRYTQEDTQELAPGDLAFSFVNQIQELSIYFGAAPSSTATTTSNI